MAVFSIIFSTLIGFFPMIIVIALIASLAKKNAKKGQHNPAPHRKPDVAHIDELFTHMSAGKPSRDAHVDLDLDGECDRETETPDIHETDPQKKTWLTDTEQDISTEDDFQKYYYAAQAKGEELDPWDIPKENTPWDK